VSEMQYRTVVLEARVLSGSDDHARWQVYWALNGEEATVVEDVLINRLEVADEIAG